MTQLQAQTCLAAGRQILIPEILSLVLSYHDTRDLARLVTVCHSWSEVVLDILWGYHLTSAIPLLKILGPVVKQERTKVSAAA